MKLVKIYLILHLGKVIKPEEAGIVTAQLKSSEKQPFMVAFFKSDLNLVDSAVTLPIAKNLPLKVENETDKIEEPVSTRSRRKRDLKKKKKSADHSSVSSFKHLVSGKPFFCKILLN